MSALENTPAFHDTLLPSRLARAILPSVSVILSPQSDIPSRDAEITSKNRKGKKRGRGYEGDEAFKVTRAVICPTKEDGEVVMASLQGECGHGILIRYRSRSPI